MNVLAVITFLTPRGGLVVLATGLPLAALVLGRRRLVRACAVVRLAPPPLAREAAFALAPFACVVLLAAAATQPVVASDTGNRRIRTDAEAMFVFDISRSMLAAGSPNAETRLSRARTAAVQLRSALPEIPAGVATLTDHVSPNLFPIADEPTFEATARRVVHVLQVPPLEAAPNATFLPALTSVASDGFFTPQATRRLVIMLTDGESRPFDAEAAARALRRGHVQLVLVHVWAPDERVYGEDGAPERYRPDATSAQLLTSFAEAAGGQSFDEHELDAAGLAARAALGRGPTRPEERSVRRRALGPFLALAALLPLVFVMWRRNLLGRAPRAALSDLRWLFGRGS